jgi:hypothetical protein
MGFVRILTEEELKAELPENLKISRVAIVPQTDRRGRIILNLSADVELPSYRPKGKRRRVTERHPSVNETTVPAADQSGVEALGSARPAILKFMFETDCEWEIDWQKVDLSDGFWRMIVAHGEEYNFVFQMPRRPGDTVTHFVVPGALQMGWKNSPAYFCGATETVRELIRRLLALTLTTGELPPHRHEWLCVDPFPPDASPWKPPTDIALFSRVFVDDTMNGLAGPKNRPTRNTEQLWMSRATLHAVHAIFPPPEVLGHTGGKDSISEKKLGKGDARFKQTEVLLGFEMQGGAGKDRRVRLPPSRKDKYSSQINNALTRPRNYTTFRDFRAIHGKLTFASNAIPCMRGLMTPLNRALQLGPGGIPPSIVGLGETSETREALSLCNKLLDLMTEQPSHITEIVPPDLPHYYGYVDFAACGMGGVLLPCTRKIPALVWRLKNPPYIEQQARLHDGSISNSDGEAAAVFVSELSLEHWTGDNTAGVSTHLGSDNSPTVGWNNRMASRATHKAPERFLRWQALRQRWTRRGPCDVEHIPGHTNRLGDFPSRSFEQGFPAGDDDAFLKEFSRRHPLPSQLDSWQLVQPPKSVILATYSILSGRYDTTTCPETVIGESGVHLPCTLANTLSSTTSKDPPCTWNEATVSWPLLAPSGEVSSSKLEELRHRRSRRPYMNAQGSWSTEDLRTLAEQLQAKPT